MQRADSLKKTLMLGKTEGSDRGWDVWMASLTQWTHVWTNSGRQGSMVCCSPWVTKSWTWLSDWMTNGVCVGVRVGGLRFTHPRLDTERGWRGQSSSLQMISGWMLFHHHFVFHSVCLLFTWLRAWESGKHDRDIWKEKRVLRYRGQRDVEGNQGPHSTWTDPSHTAYHSVAMTHQLRHKPSFSVALPSMPLNLSHHVLFWPRVFPWNAVPSACNFQGNVHTHPLFKICVWCTKVTK